MPIADAVQDLPVTLHAVGGSTALPTLLDPQGRLAAQLRARPGMLCLIRPDAYLAARLERVDAATLRKATRTALGCEAPDPSRWRRDLSGATATRAQ